MKYKYSKFMTFLMWSSIPLLVVVLSVAINSFDNNLKLFNKNIITGLGLSFVMISLYIGEYLKRYVEIKKESVYFNSFRFKNKVINLNVPYGDILSIEVIKLPILGVFKVKVKAKNVPWSIPVTWCISHHNEMYAKLCKNAREGNPNVYIDDKLIEYLAKKGYYEAD